MADFARFTTFPIFPTEVAQNDLEWPISPNFQLFPPKHLIFGEMTKFFIPEGGHIGNSFEFFNFLNHFTPKWLKMTYDGKFCQKSGLLWWEKIGKVVNWVKLAIVSHSEPLWWKKIGKVANG